MTKRKRQRKTPGAKPRVRWSQPNNCAARLVAIERVRQGYPVRLTTLAQLSLFAERTTNEPAIDPDGVARSKSNDADVSPSVWRSHLRHFQGWRPYFSHLFHGRWKRVKQAWSLSEHCRACAKYHEQASEYLPECSSSSGRRNKDLPGAVIVLCNFREERASFWGVVMTLRWLRVRGPERSHGRGSLSRMSNGTTCLPPKGKRKRRRVV